MINLRWLSRCVIFMSCAISYPLLAQECPDLSLGTIRVEPFEEISTIVDQEEYTLGYGRSIRLHHNGDQSSSLDPDPSTPSGIAYLAFRSEPINIGSRWSDVLNHPDLVTMDGHPQLISGDQHGNRAIFQNVGDHLQRPSSVWIVPAFIDDMAKAWEEIPILGTESSCAHIGIDQAVKVNLLNPITVEFGDHTDSTIEVTVNGGLSEFREEEVYEYQISGFAKSSLTGESLDTSGLLQNAESTWLLLGSGLYGELAISDKLGEQKLIEYGFGFPRTRSKPLVVVNSESQTAEKGDTLRLNVYSNANNQLLSYYFDMAYDPTELRYVDFINNDSSSRTDVFSIGKGQLIIYDSLSMGINEVKPTNLNVNLIFESVGRAGTKSSIFYTSLVNSLISGINEPINLIAPSSQVITTAPQNIDFDYSGCVQTSGEVSLNMQISRGIGPFALLVIDSIGDTILNYQAESSTFVRSFESGFNPHDIRLTDARGMSVDKEIVFPNEPLSLGFDLIHSNCGADNGSIRFKGTLDSNEHNFLVLNKAHSGFESVRHLNENGMGFSDLSPDTYTLSILGQNSGCRVDSTIIIKDTLPILSFEFDRYVYPCEVTPPRSPNVRIEVSTNSKSEKGAIVNWIITDPNGRILPQRDSLGASFGLTDPHPSYITLIPVGPGTHTAQAIGRDSCSSEVVHFELVYEDSCYRIVILDGDDDNTSSIGEADKPKSNEIIVYPNPAHDMLHIDLSNFTHNHEWLSVYDQLGRRILTRKLHPQEKEVALSTSRYPQGVYFVEVADQKHGRSVKQFQVFR